MITIRRRTVLADARAPRHPGRVKTGATERGQTIGMIVTTVIGLAVGLFVGHAAGAAGIGVS